MKPRQVFGYLAWIHMQYITRTKCISNAVVRLVKMYLKYNSLALFHSHPHLIEMKDLFRFFSSFGFRFGSMKTTESTSVECSTHPSPQLHRMSERHTHSKLNVNFRKAGLTLPLMLNVFISQLV